jgi:hypothetical protein
LIENPLVINDDEDNDPIDRPNRTSHQMTVNDLGIRGENTDKDASSAAHTGEVVANSNLDDTAIIQDDHHSAIVTFTSFSPEIPESDSRATLDEEWRLRLSVQADSISNPPSKQSRSLSGSGWAGGHSSD